MSNGEIAIKVENLSKQYRLGTVGTGTISHDLNRWWARVRGKEDPFLKIGETNDRSKAANSDYVWSLKDINFEVKQGEVLGIIGKNGAGKSTLLKILSKVTGPTTGRISAKGRIGALLEVGTGFHPELTGRENIFLNGAILGMTKAEIKAKLDEIIDFSGCARYVDTPVKRYSSGMKVRLAFAVAAFLEPEILIVDEVLAVGDVEFQKKAIGKMQDVSKGEGRTVLFVSHNMSAVRNLCTRGLLLTNGNADFIGGIEDTIEKYLRGGEERTRVSEIRFEVAQLPICFTKINVESINEFDEDIDITFELYIGESRPDYTVGFLLYDSKGNCLFVSTYDETGLSLIKPNTKGVVSLSAQIPKRILKPGDYMLNCTVRTLQDGPIHKVDDMIKFNVLDTITFRGLKSMYRDLAMVAPEIKWSRI